LLERLRLLHQGVQVEWHGALLLAEVAHVLDLAAEDLDGGADRRVLAGGGDAVARGGGALLLLLLGDAGVGRGLLLDDLQRGAESERFFEGVFEGRFGFADDLGLTRPLSEADLDAGAVDLDRDRVLQSSRRARFPGRADRFDQMTKTGLEIERSRFVLLLVLAFLVALFFLDGRA